MTPTLAWGRREGDPMAPQEIIVSACSSETSSSTNPNRPTSVPSIHIHDLLTSTHIHGFKTSVSSLHSTYYIPSQRGVGGALLAVQEGKALANVWAWQKVSHRIPCFPDVYQDQLHAKIHLPEKLSCFTVSSKGCWAAGGSPSGQIYLWEVSDEFVRSL